MYLPGIASFRFERASETVSATTPASTSDDLLADAFRRMLVPMALHVRGFEVLHASAVLVGGGIVALCGVSTAGKSTLAYACARRGHQLWADDAVVLDRRDGGFFALPLPFGLRLRSESATFFDRDGEDGKAWPTVAPEPAVLRSIVVLERVKRGRVATSRLSPERSFPATLEHAYCFDLEDEERRRAMVETYLEIAGRVPVFRLRFQPGLGNVAAMVDAVEQTVSVAAAEVGAQP